MCRGGFYSPPSTGPLLIQMSLLPPGWNVFTQRWLGQTQSYWKSAISGLEKYCTFRPTGGMPSLTLGRRCLFHPLKKTAAQLMPVT